MIKIMDIAKFDPIPTDDLYEYVFGYECEALSNAFESIGYECQHNIQNLGSLFLFEILVPIIGLLLIILIAIKCLSEKIK